MEVPGVHPPKAQRNRTNLPWDVLPFWIPRKECLHDIINQPLDGELSRRDIWVSEKGLMGDIVSLVFNDVLERRGPWHGEEPIGRRFDTERL